MTATYSLKLVIAGDTIRWENLRVNWQVGQYFPVLTATVELVVKEGAEVIFVLDGHGVFEGFVHLVEKVDDKRVNITAHGWGAKLGPAFSPKTDETEYFSTFSNLCATYAGRFGIGVSLPAGLDFSSCDPHINRGGNAPGDIIKELAEEVGYTVVQKIENSHTVEIIQSPQPIDNNPAFEISADEIIGEPTIGTEPRPPGLGYVQVYCGCPSNPSDSGGSTLNPSITAEVKGCPPSIYFSPCGGGWDNRAEVIRGCFYPNKDFSTDAVLETFDVFESGWNTVTLKYCVDPARSSPRATIDGHYVTSEAKDNQLTFYKGNDTPGRLLVTYHPLMYRAGVHVDNGLYWVQLSYAGKVFDFKGAVDTCDDDKTNGGAPSNGGISIEMPQCGKFVLKSRNPIPGGSFLVVGSDGGTANAKPGTPTSGIRSDSVPLGSPFIGADGKRYIEVPPNTVRFVKSDGGTATYPIVEIDGVKCAKITDAGVPINAIVEYTMHWWEFQADVSRWKEFTFVASPNGKDVVRKTFSCDGKEPDKYIIESCELPMRVRINIAALTNVGVSGLQNGAYVVIGNRQYHADQNGYITAVFNANGSYKIEPHNFKMKRVYYCHVEVP